MEKFKPPVFPFTAIVGQETLKLALIISVIHPGVMGVLIRGQKGTAKSTTVRAFSNLLPRINTVRNCMYGCDPGAPLQTLCRDCQKIISEGSPFDTEFISVPFVTLPVNATEDNLAGSIDLEHAIKSGKTKFQTGLLARTHRGILYVDEVNLLDDHLVDLILDTAGSGVNIVAREGVSVSHPSRFVLAGTMNPEEGELRPQFLDKFGLCIGIGNVTDLSQRVEIIKRQEAFEKDPLLFHAKWSEEEKKEALRIKNAVDLVESVQTNDNQRKDIAILCKGAEVAGHRADLVIDNASKAIAAYMGRQIVDDRDISLAAAMALPHRARKITGNDVPQKEDKCKIPEIRNQFADIKQDTEESQEKSYPLNKKTDLSKTKDRDSQITLYRQDIPCDNFDDQINEASRSSGRAENRIYEIGSPVTILTGDICHDRRIISRNSGGRRNRFKTVLKRGRYVRSTMSRVSNDIAIDATLRAAAPYQTLRQKGQMTIKIETQDFRYKIRERKTNTLLIFIVDASGSMGARLMTETKGAIMYLLMEAYQKRDRVCMIAFKDERAELLLPPTDSIELAKKKLEKLPSGGKTPLAAGLLQGYLVASKSFYSKKNLLPLLVLITDGRANMGMDSLGVKTGTNVFHIFKEIYTLASHIHQEAYINSLILDTEEKSSIRLGRAKEIAAYMGAKYMILNEIQSQKIAGAVRVELGR